MAQASGDAGLAAQVVFGRGGGHAAFGQAIGIGLPAVLGLQVVGAGQLGGCRSGQLLRGRGLVDDGRVGLQRCLARGGLGVGRSSLLRLGLLQVGLLRSHLGAGRVSRRIGLLQVGGARRLQLVDAIGLLRGGDQGGLVRVGLRGAEALRRDGALRRRTECGHQDRCSNQGLFHASFSKGWRTLGYNSWRSS